MPCVLPVIGLLDQALLSWQRKQAQRVAEGCRGAHEDARVRRLGPAVGLSEDERGHVLAVELVRRVGQRHAGQRQHGREDVVPEE